MWNARILGSWNSFQNRTWITRRLVDSRFSYIWNDYRHTSLSSREQEWIIRKNLIPYFLDAAEYFLKFKEFLGVNLNERPQLKIRFQRQLRNQGTSLVYKNRMGRHYPKINQAILHSENKKPDRYFQFWSGIYWMWYWIFFWCW